MGGECSKTTSTSFKGTQIYLNVYNLQSQDGSSTINQALGFGVFHSGVELWGTEYTFGGAPSSNPVYNQMCGIFPMKPRSALPPNQFHKQHELGSLPADVTPKDAYNVLLKMSSQWTAGDYHLLEKNCNHFSEAFVTCLSNTFLTPRGLEAMEFPRYVNRAARTGTAFIPAALYKIIMRNTPKPPSAAESSFPTSPPIPKHHTSAQQHKPTPQSTSASAPSKDAYPLPKSADAARDMSIKDLKATMEAHRISRVGLVEKGDLVEAIMQYKSSMS